MRLHSLRMEGFRRHLDTTVFFSDATFLIGENNVGKSSVFYALDYLLNDKKAIPEKEFFQITDTDPISDQKINKTLVDNVVLTAEFRNLPVEARQWTGFKGRLLKYDCDSDETGLSIVYKKTFHRNGGHTIEMKEYSKNLKSEYSDCKTIDDFVQAGLDKDKLISMFKITDENKSLTQAQRKKIHESAEFEEELYDFDEQEEAFFKNPGGIAGNVLSKLPRYLLIPAQDEVGELDTNKGQLQTALTELFNDVRDRSPHFLEAQNYLNKLKAEMDPRDNETEFGQMMIELNDVLSDVFSDTVIHAEADLSNADAIKPSFNISIESNVSTEVKLQGTGVIRSAVFALLRYRKKREAQLRMKDEYIAPLLIAFEEPEIYLHPNAATQMRETIYELASSENDQIVCTTHSPYMIDLSEKPSQILNHLSIKQREVEYGNENYPVDSVVCSPFNVTQKFKQLVANEKDYVKMLLKIDSEIAKVFFAKNILIIEGDTEEIVLKETLDRMDKDFRDYVKKDWQVVKARGKATIIPLVKYFKSMGLHSFVMHDRDNDVEKARSFNDSILRELGDSNSRIMLEECIEDVLGYQPPSSDKPYNAYKYIQDNWGDDWEGVSSEWRTIVELIFNKRLNEVEELV